MVGSGVIGGKHDHSWVGGKHKTDTATEKQQLSDYTQYIRVAVQ